MGDCGVMEASVAALAVMKTRVRLTAELLKLMAEL